MVRGPVLLCALRSRPSAGADEVPRIASVSGSGDSKIPGRQIEGFRQELTNLGYVEE